MIRQEGRPDIREKYVRIAKDAENVAGNIFTCNAR
jgi:hypothetical protein